MTWDGLSPPYGTIVADPPWTLAPIHRYRLGSKHRLVYRTMSDDEICALPVAEIAHDDAYLLLWATRERFREGTAARVARAWGFEPQTELIWEKKGLGTGGWPRPCHEPVLVARRGCPATPPARSLRSVQRWVSPPAHSTKPVGLADLAETNLPGPWVELFARQQRLGWDHWGHGYEIGASA